LLNGRHKRPTPDLDEQRPTRSNGDPRVHGPGRASGRTAAQRGLARPADELNLHARDPGRHDECVLAGVRERLRAGGRQRRSHRQLRHSRLRHNNDDRGQHKRPKTSPHQPSFTLGRGHAAMIDP
jgi:hypothetical protein